MTYEARNEPFFLLNKVLNKCLSCHYKTLLSLGTCEAEKDNLPPVLRAEEKVTVHFLNRDGKRITVKALTGESLLDVVVNNDLDIDGFGACEGTLACSTCHLIFEEAVYKKLGAVSDEEMDMLDLAYGLSDTSRLGCQVCLRKDLDGMILRVPDVISDARVDSEKESSTAPPKV
uniref:Adrenodoxin-like n=1 Tax=Sinocyclocheilus anshuiensis TaxID=1608454 RepID=A0A671SVR3_9TELE